MSEPEGGESSVLFCEASESIDDDGEFREDHGEGLANEDEVGIAGYELE